MYHTGKFRGQHSHGHKSAREPVRGCYSILWSCEILL